MSNDMMKDSTSIQLDIRCLMAERGITSITELADKMNADRAHLADCVKGRREWTENYLARVAAALNVNVSRFLKPRRGPRPARKHSQESPGKYDAEDGEQRGISSDAAESTEVTVPDDSMKPLMRQGQEILCCPEHTPRDGDIAYVEIEDEPYVIARVYKDEGQWILQPCNDAFRPRVVPEDDIVRAWKVWAIKV